MIKNNEKVDLQLVKFTTHYHLLLESPVEYPKRETKHDIKESESNMFHPIFTEMAQMQKHSGRCVVAETKLPS